MFKYSPAVGGQMGMSWSVLMAIQAASLAWVQTRAPKLGTLVAEDKYGELDTLFRRLTLLSLGFVTAGGASLWGFVYLLHVLQHPLAERLAERVLPLDSLGIFTLAIVLYHVPHCQALYIRAHKREMMLFVGVFSSIAIGTLVWVLGGKFGPIGAAGGYLAVVALFVLPYQTFVWRRCQQERSPADSSAEADAVSNSST
jgi:O-antigen/teichoic acid export membrane protein